MKQLFFFFLVLIFSGTSAQKRSYVQLGPATYVNTKGGAGLIGGSVGAGSSIGYGGAGINIELLSLSGKLILPVYADVRFYFNKKPTSLYVSFQPGYNFRNNRVSTDQNTTTKDKGGFYFGSGVGFFIAREKLPGFNVQFRYVFLQDKFSSTYTYTDNSSVTKALNRQDGFLSLAAYVVF